MIVNAPNNINTPKNSFLIFLSGSAEKKKSEIWRQILQEEFKDDKSIVWLNPVREDWKENWGKEKKDPLFVQQVNWELNGLEIADLIIIYFEKDSMSAISFIELGLFARSEKIVVCCTDGFWKKGHIEIICKQYSIPLLNNMQELIEYLKIKSSKK